MFVSLIKLDTAKIEYKTDLAGVKSQNPRVPIVYGRRLHTTVLKML